VLKTSPINNSFFELSPATPHNVNSGNSSVIGPAIPPAGYSNQTPFIKLPCFRRIEANLRTFQLNSYEVDANFHILPINFYTFSVNSCGFASNFYRFQADLRKLKPDFCNLDASLSTFRLNSCTLQVDFYGFDCNFCQFHFSFCQFESDFYEPRLNSCDPKISLRDSYREDTKAPRRRNNNLRLYNVVPTVSWIDLCDDRLAPSRRENNF
jgi:hypothetical protein